MTMPLTGVDNDVYDEGYEKALKECKKMFDNYTEKLKECVKNYNIPSDPLLKLDIEDDIDKLSKEVMGE